jgi:oligoendopeptidase F
MTLEEYNAIMEEIAWEYGGISYINENIMDVQIYWKQVVLESPVYYLSYAVSSVVAMDLFSVAQTDEETAHSIYCKLIEEGDSQQGFLWNIQQAGFAGPFEETVYQKLQNIF